MSLQEFPHLKGLLEEQKKKIPRVIRVNPVSKFEKQYKSLMTQNTPSGKLINEPFAR